MFKPRKSNTTVPREKSGPRFLRIIVTPVVAYLYAIVFWPKLAKGGGVGQLNQLRWSLEQTHGEFSLHLVSGREEHKKPTNQPKARSFTPTRSSLESARIQGHTRTMKKYIPSYPITCKWCQGILQSYRYYWVYHTIAGSNRLFFLRISQWFIAGSVKTVLTAVWHSDDQCPKHSLVTGMLSVSLQT